MPQVDCAYCNAVTKKLTGEINRAKKKGAPIYCNKICAGFGRRHNKTKTQLKGEKRIYDMEFRRKNKEILRIKKKEYFQKTYDPEKAAIERKSNMPRHVEYCRQPKYREYKKEYDAKYRAKNDYGEFWEAFFALREVEQEIRKRMSWYEIEQQNGTLNKHQQRRRDYERTNCN